MLLRNCICGFLSFAARTHGKLILRALPKYPKSAPITFIQSQSAPVITNQHQSPPFSPCAPLVSLCPSYVPFSLQCHSVSPVSRCPFHVPVAAKQGLMLHIFTFGHFGSRTFWQSDILVRHFCFFDSNMCPALVLSHIADF
jgi:hypothetical protein